MVYVVGSEYNNEEQEIEIDVNSSQASGPVSSSRRLEFILELVGIPSDDLPLVLEKAKDMGLTADDLGFIEQQDVDSLLSECSSLQRRKFVQVCEYLKHGGTLAHGMTMTDVYDKNKKVEEIDNQEEEKQEEKEEETPPSATSATSPSAADVPSSTQQNSAPNKNYFDNASKAFNQIPQQLRKWQRFKRQLRGIVNALKGCFKF